MNHFNFLPEPQQIKEDIANNGYAIYHDVIDKRYIELLKSFWTDYFLHVNSNTKVARGTFLLGEKNFTSRTKNNFWHLYRDFDFLWNQATHKPTRDLNIALHKLRNLAQGFEKNKGLLYGEDNYSVYISTSHYPPNGGFLQPHIDDHKDVPLIHFMIPITFKGIDYDSGGLSIVDNSGKLIDVDEHVKHGSVLFFDGRNKHGIEPIQSKGNIGRIGTFAIPTFFLTQENLPILFRTLYGEYHRYRNTLLKYFNKS